LPLLATNPGDATKCMAEDTRILRADFGIFVYAVGDSGVFCGERMAMSTRGMAARDRLHRRLRFTGAQNLPVST